MRKQFRKILLFTLAVILSANSAFAQSTQEEPTAVEKVVHWVFIADNRIIAEGDAKENSTLVSLPEAPKLPNKKFSKWIPDPNKPLTKDTIFTAVYENIPVVKYFVSFVADGRVIYETEVEENTLATIDYLRIPEPKNKQFIQWQPSITQPIKKDTVFIAQYREINIPKETEFLEQDKSELQWLIEILSGRKTKSIKAQTILSMAGKTLSNRNATRREIDEMLSLLKEAIYSSQEDITLTLSPVEETADKIEGITEKNAAITIRRGKETLARGKADEYGSFSIPISDLKANDILTVTAEAEITSSKYLYNSRFQDLIGADKREVVEIITVRASGKKLQSSEKTLSFSYKVGFSKELEIRNNRLVEKKIDISIPERDGIAQVPIRNVCARYGVSVFYNPENRTITLRKNDNTITLEVDSGYTIDNEGFALPINPLTIVKGRAFINPYDIGLLLKLSENQLIVDNDMVIFVVL